MKPLDFFQSLQQAELAKISHQKIIRLIKREGIQVPVLTALVKAGAIIERGRVCNQGTVFPSEFDISYRLDIGNIMKYGRANRPFQSMFYGAMPSVVLNHPTQTLFEELVGQFEESLKEGFKTTMTVGRWIVKKDMEVADICYGQEYLNVKENAERFEHWRNELPKTEIDSPDNQELLRLFSTEFSKSLVINHANYKISSVYTDLALGEGLAGISYPSVRTDYNSRNIALTPSAVDEYLELTEAGVFEYEFHNGKAEARQTKYSNDLGFMNSKFNW